MQKNLTFDQAMSLLDEGKLVSYLSGLGIGLKRMVQSKYSAARGYVLDTPYLDDYKNRTDWEQTDGLRDFGGALVAVKAGKMISRQGWNGKGLFVFQQIPSEIPKEIVPKM